MDKIFDCIILGAGPAGMSAGIYCARGNIKCAIMDITMFGGAPVNYLEIENYPGFKEIEGWELSEKFEEHLNKFEIEKFPMVEIKSVDLVSDIKTITDISGKEYKAKSIILATGAKPQKLGVEGEIENIGKGVSYCAVCDGAFYKDKVVAVVGGGNAALEEGSYLTRFAKKVYLIHRRNEFRADKIVQERIKQNEKIEFVLDSVVEKIINGGAGVSQIEIKNVKTGEKTTLDVDGVFPYIGFKPNCELFNGQVEQDQNGFVKTDVFMQTNVEGVFAIGDLRTTPLRQVITAVADGAIAGVSAVKYLETKESKVLIK